MNKLIISNLLTATLIISWFNFNSSKKETFKSEGHHSTSQNYSTSIRKPSALHTYRKITKKPDAKESLKEKAEFLYDKYNVDQHNWKDLVIQIYKGEKEVNGKKIIISDVYQDFYKSTFKKIKNYYPRDAEDRFETYLSLKMEKEAEREYLERERQNRYTNLENDLGKKIKVVERNLDLSQEKKDNLINELNEKHNVLMSSSTSSPYFIFDQELEHLEKNYHSNIRKVLGLAYKDLVSDVDQYNYELKSEYGKEIYYSTYDHETGTKLPEGQKIEVEGTRPMFSIDL
jgi:hypothetical protein